MSRSGYVDDLASDEPLQYGRWRGRVASAIRGARGQKFLKDTLAALDAMPDKRLIDADLINEDQVCTLGAALLARGIGPDSFDPRDHEGIGAALNIAPCLVQEIEYMNDEAAPYDPEERWQWMRRAVQKLIKETPASVV